MLKYRGFLPIFKWEVLVNKFMRMIVWFDLPVKTGSEKKAATKFRKFLLKDGYNMMQWSVYTRLCNGMDSVETHKRRIKPNLPARGSIRSLVLTEKQYEAIDILLGERHYDESPESKNLLDFF